MNSKTPLIVLILILIISPFLAQEASSEGTQQGSSLSVTMGFLGKSNGDGTHSTQALSISVGAGNSGFHGMVLGNNSSVATAVGSAGTELIGPNGQVAHDQVFESNICVSTLNGICPY